MIPKRRKHSNFWQPAKNSLQISDPYKPPITLNMQWFIEKRKIPTNWIMAIILTALIGIAMLISMILATFNTYRADGYYDDRLVETLQPSHRSNGQAADLSDRINKDTNSETTQVKLHNFPALKSNNLQNTMIIAGQPFQLLIMPLDIIGNKKFTYPSYSEMILSHKGSSTYNTSLPLHTKDQDLVSDIGVRATMHEIPSTIFTSKPNYYLSDNIIYNMVNTPEDSGLTEDGDESLANLTSVQITNDNVSVSSSDKTDKYAFIETLYPIKRPQSVKQFFSNQNLLPSAPESLINQLEQQLHGASLTTGMIIRTAVEQRQANYNKIVRLTLYNNSQPIITIALNSNKQYQPATTPETSETIQKQIKTLTSDIHNLKISNKSISLYDALYQTALSNGLAVQTIAPVISGLSERVDLKANVKAGDQIQLFYQIPDRLLKLQQAGSPIPLLQTDILYFVATINGKQYQYYLYKLPDNTSRYYDKNNKSIGVSILRKPVENARFSSPFGARRHPILGYVRLHTGIDWAAKIGTPIMAAGDGIIVSMGARSGYGNHTEIRHSNGYITSYSHQSRFARGLKVGSRVSQRQIIGYIGNTGLSTGPHLHYEIIVNGTKVDPLRVRLPDHNPLTETDLEKFIQEKNTIDSILDPK